MGTLLGVHPIVPWQMKGIPKHKLLIQGLGYVSLGVCWNNLKQIVFLVETGLPGCMDAWFLWYLGR